MKTIFKIFITALSLSFITSFAYAMDAKNDTKNIEITEIGNNKIHTFYGISNSHIIETPNQLILIDMQFNFKLATKLNGYIKTLKKPLSKIILSHSHPDHWFGYPIFKDVPIVTTAGVMADLDNRGADYIKRLQKKMAKIIPTKPVKPLATIKLGEQNWDGLDVIVEQYTEQEAHHSILIKIPQHKIMIGQDLFYNNMHLVASERSRNNNWIKILQSFQKNDAKSYDKILTGHGKNTDTSVFADNITYLQKLEQILASGANKKETKEQLLKAFPDRGGKAFINITVGNLFAHKQKKK
jgi:glyoxylase-like metal-dependent hydrolase (beta-lactamase superfamily II)